MNECETCQGTGVVPDRSGPYPEKPGVIAGPFIDYSECPDCHGTGWDEGEFQ